MNEIREREREVEQAREKLRLDLMRVMRPGAYGELQGEVVAEAKDAVRSRAETLIEEIKYRAMANPVAAAAIGAGLAYRVIKRPPIASVLVGAGLYSLLNTQPQEPGHSVTERVIDRGQDALDSARQTADSWRETGRTASATVMDKGRELLDDARRTAHDWRTDAAQTAETLKERVGAAAESVTQVTEDARTHLANPVNQDRYLLGVAGLAIAAALGISIQRRLAAENGHLDEQNDRPRW